MKIICVLSLLLVKSDGINKFTSLAEFNHYLQIDGKFVDEICELSDDNEKYYYNSKGNEILFFDYSAGYGFVCDFKIAKDSLKANGLDLRSILAKQIFGIEFSRNNYLEFNNRDDFEKLIKSPQNKIEIICHFAGVETIKLDTLMSDSILSMLSNKLNAMDRESVMQYEIPLLLLFTEYAKSRYGNRVEINQMKNVFNEEYFGITINCPHNIDVNLTDMLHEFLYPEFDRDDYETEEEAIIDLTRIKELIDYFNSKKVLKF